MPNSASSYNRDSSLALHISMVSNLALPTTSRIRPPRVMIQDENIVTTSQQQSKSLQLDQTSSIPLTGTTVRNTTLKKPLLKKRIVLIEASIPNETSKSKSMPAIDSIANTVVKRQPLTGQEPAKRNRPPIILPVPTQTASANQIQPKLLSQPAQRTAPVLIRASSASKPFPSKRQPNAIGPTFAPGTARIASTKLDSGNIRKPASSSLSSLKQSAKSVAFTNSILVHADAQPAAICIHTHGNIHVKPKNRRSAEKIPAAPRMSTANRYRSQIPAMSRSSVQSIQRPTIPGNQCKTRQSLRIPSVPLFDSSSSDQDMEDITTTNGGHQTFTPDMDLDIIFEQEDYDQDPSLVSEYQAAIFTYKREMEIKLMPDPNYMNRQSDLTWHYRVQLIEWLVQVHDRFDLLQETMHLCVNYLDRFLSKVVIPISQLQLAGMVALLLASKYEEIQAPAIETLVYFGGGDHTPSRIREAEIGMLRALNYDLGAPGPMSFLRRISRADDYDVDIRTLAKYLIDVTLCDHRFIGLPSSMIAAVGYRASMRLLFRGEWTTEHEAYSGYKEPTLTAGINVLLTMLEQPAQSHQALFKKYQDERHMNSSDYVHLLGLHVLRSLHCT
ncbi:hypothetical protein BGX27_003600 [Mortierella sp. AM989]|nr:hypothetical protein BGX27_003600 [Mortierella sp. AM989]